MKFHAAVLAGTHSSVGKTTWALGLMGFARRRGLEVQPFKVGPDYIDPGFHTRVCHPRKSRNLDRFFLSEDYLKESFAKNAAASQLALIEGVMGLYDGRSPVSEEGSSAEMAKILGLPVFLVLDGAGLARSAAAVVKGFQSFDPRLELAGVFLNRVGSEGHFRWLREPIEKETGIPVLGWLPEEGGVSIPERHLGLQTAAEEDFLDEKLVHLINLLEGRLDFDRFLKLSEIERPSSQAPLGEFQKVCRIGVAHDRAFSFYYEDNFDLLQAAGAELVFFSALEDRSLPNDLDALYLGGGFPELYAPRLSENQTMKDSIRNFYREGGLIYAECGGLIYLTEAFLDSEEKVFPFLGLLPGKVRMTKRLQNFGYHEMEAAADTFLFRKGERLRSHEFHYSVWETPEARFPQPYRIKDRGEGFFDGQILASYQHLHFGQSQELSKNFVRAACALRKKHVYHDQPF